MEGDHVDSSETQTMLGYVGKRRGLEKEMREFRLSDKARLLGPVPLPLIWRLGILPVLSSLLDNISIAIPLPLKSVDYVHLGDDSRLCRRTALKRT